MGSATVSRRNGDTARRAVIVLFGPLVLCVAPSVCGGGGGATTTPATTLQTLTTTIDEGEGRAVYEAFRAIPQNATTPEAQAEAFDALSGYLGQFDRRCVVGDYYPPSHRTTSKSFSYAELAAGAILRLGEPARRGLVAKLADERRPVAEHAAVILCAIEESGRRARGTPDEADFPPLSDAQRTALDAFLGAQGEWLSVHALTRFVSAGFPAAADHIHRRLKATRDLDEARQATFWLGAYGHGPALDDLLTILREHGDAHLRRIVAGKLENFADADRTTAALEEALKEDGDEDVRTSCRIALGVIRSKRQPAP